MRRFRFQFPQRLVREKPSPLVYRKKVYTIATALIMGIALIPSIYFLFKQEYLGVIPIALFPFSQLLGRKVADRYAPLKPNS